MNRVQVVGKGRLWLLAFMLVCLLPVSTLAKEPIRTIHGTVTKVIDGDTVHITDQHGTRIKIRLYGIDAPEIEGHNKPGQPYGKESHQALKQKIDRQLVQADVIDIDRYKRLVSVIRIGHRNINIEMVAEGNAWAYRTYLHRPYASEYIAAEELARSIKNGLWRQPNPQPPWEFRR